MRLFHAIGDNYLASAPHRACVELLKCGHHSMAFSTPSALPRHRRPPPHAAPRRQRSTSNRDAIHTASNSRTSATFKQLTVSLSERRRRRIALVREMEVCKANRLHRRARPRHARLPLASTCRVWRNDLCSLSVCLISPTATPRRFVSHSRQRLSAGCRR